MARSGSTKAALLGAALASLMAGGALAQSGGIVRAVDAGDVSGILKGAGTDNVVVRDGSDGHIVDGSYKGVPISIGLVDCDGPRCGQLGYTAYFGKQDLKPDFVYAYNKNHPVRLVFRGSGEAALYYDIFIKSGVTMDFVKDSTVRFLNGIEQASTYKVEE